MTPEHYADVVYERSAAHLCGWPLCDQSVSAAGVSGKYKVDRRVGIVEASAARDYHASTCLMNSKLYAQQLSNEPVYLRTKFTPPVIEQFQEHVSSPVTESSTDWPSLVIKERDTDNDVIEMPKLESAKTQAIEGYVYSKNSNIPAVTQPLFSETQKQEVESDDMPDLEPVTKPDDQRDLESDDSDLDENIDLLGNFFISSKEIPIPELSIFGSLWTTFSHWITPETRHWLRGTEPSRDTSPSVTGVTHDIAAEDSAVHALPATDSEAPELIRRNTVKHMLFK